MPLDGAAGRRGISLFVSVFYRVHRDGNASWRVDVGGYRYDVLDRDDREILAYHWHPAALGPPFPHVHLTGRLPAIEVGPGLPPVALGDMHLPTGRITFAAVARLLIQEFGVAPRRPEWAAEIEIADRDERRLWTD